MLETFLSYLLVYQYTLLFFCGVFCIVWISDSSERAHYGGRSIYGRWIFRAFPILLCSACRVVSGDIIRIYPRTTIWKSFSLRSVWGVYSNQNSLSLLSHSFGKMRAWASSSRFLITVMGPAVNILSGIARIPLSRFITADVLGEILYVCLYGGIGYMFWNEWEYMLSILQNLSTFLLSCFLLFLLLFFSGNSKKKYSHSHLFSYDWTKLHRTYILFFSHFVLFR